MNRDIKEWIGSLPTDFHLIVGIPRSGLLVANLLALHLNLPFTDVDGFVSGRVFSTGRHFSKGVELASGRCALKVFVVDDTVRSGRQLSATRQKIAAAKLSHEITYGVVYARRESDGMVDRYYELVPPPRVFEWNVMNHPCLKESCVDIDGVLCRDPTRHENDDGPSYREFLSTVRPRYIPGQEIGWLVTSRLEKYRHLTEEWLARHEVRYGELVMMDCPSAAARRAGTRHATYKAAVYRRTNARLFIESDERQAAEIALLTRRPVFCATTREMFYPGVKPGNRRHPSFRDRMAWLLHRIRRKGERELGALKSRIARPMT